MNEKLFKSGMLAALLYSDSQVTQANQSTTRKASFNSAAICKFCQLERIQSAFSIANLFLNKIPAWPCPDRPWWNCGCDIQIGFKCHFRRVRLAMYKKTTFHLSSAEHSIDVIFPRNIKNDNVCSTLWRLSHKHWLRFLRIENKKVYRGSIAPVELSPIIA